MMTYSIRISLSLLDRLTQRAKKEGMSIDVLIVEMINLGLFDLDESDKLENVQYH